MKSDQPKKIKISSAAWVVFKKRLCELWPYCLGFTAISLILNIISAKDLLHVMATFQTTLQSGEPPSYGQSLLGGLASLVSIFFDLVIIYFFTATHLQRDPIDTKPDINTNNFILWLAAISIPALVYYGRDIVTACTDIAGMGELSSTLTYGLDALGFIGLCVVVKYMFVVPLATTEIRQPLNVSAGLTQGHWWRLVWNQGTFSFTVFFCILILTLPIIFLIIYLDGKETILSIALVSFWLGLTAVIMNLSNAVFVSTACQILYDEKRQSDPYFVLKTIAKVT
jgi:hypothetical protein